MQLNPYLHFNGNCEEALKFYKQVFDGKIDLMMTYADTPMEAQVPSDWKNKIIHARMVVAGQALMASDVSSDRFQKPQGFSMSVNNDNFEEAQRVFNALAKNGNVQMPFQKTFWAEGFGMLVDQFGTPWLVNCEKAA